MPRRIASRREIPVTLSEVWFVLMIPAHPATLQFSKTRKAETQPKDRQTSLITAAKRVPFVLIDDLSVQFKLM
jgi:hypothetical protein